MTESVGLFLYCRLGFETECAAEITALARAQGVEGFCKAKPESAYVVFQTADVESALKVHENVAFTHMVFARQWFVMLGLGRDLPVTDRVSGLVTGFSTWAHGAAELIIETPDTNEAKELSALCRTIEKPLEGQLKRAGILKGKSAWRAHVCFLSGSAAYFGVSVVRNSSAWRMGIPRLRFPSSAPSRSALKLEEAFLVFLSESETTRAFRAGMRAVDLGAAPGGWTWQLVHRGLYVTAVDNGPMDERLMAGGEVEHIRADGFYYRPAQPVEWMVCDIAEKPRRVAGLLVHWLTEGWCQRTVFNLKLPMKKRYQEVELCLDMVRQALMEAELNMVVRCKQLYHDREEVTVYVGPR